jgi:hypothetical protein
VNAKKTGHRRNIEFEEDGADLSPDWVIARATFNS